MRRSIVLVLFTALLAGCGFFSHNLGTHSSDYSAGTTAVWGDWVLANPDSTSFVGAQRVELSLQPGTFTLKATYPGAAATTVSGTADMTSTGVLTLVPQGSLVTPSGRGTNLVAGQPVVLIASAAGGTMVFAPSTRADPTPSSVWHRADAAAAAGLTSSVSTRPPR